MSAADGAFQSVSFSYPLLYWPRNTADSVSALALIMCLFVIICDPPEKTRFLEIGCYI
jgi:hypothetical protein